MYPLDAAAAYPRSQWYIAGYGHEFGSTTFGRRIFDEPIIFYRTSEGEPVALWGVCVHRFSPLENCAIQNDSVVCPYHGYTYGSDGKCHTIPTGGRPSPHARLKRYPVVERGPFVWIWMGDPAAPDMDLLPNPTDIGLGDNQSDWRVDIGSVLPMKARAALLVDNLFDLSHVAFIHSKSIEGGGKLVMIPPSIKESDGRLQVGRVFSGIAFEPGTLLDRMFPVARNVGPLHSELYTEMYNPSLINASGPNISILNADGSKGAMIAHVNFVHGITPETDNSTHYFGVVTRNYSLEDAEISRLMCYQTDTVREEDVAALESVERFADHYASTRKEISTLVDEGAIKARRHLRKLVAAEHHETAG